MKAKEEEKDEGRGKERRGVGQERIEEETEEDVTCEEAEAVPKVVEESQEVEEEEAQEKAVEAVTDSKDKGEREKKAVKKLVIENLPGDTVEELLRYIYTG